MDSETQLINRMVNLEIREIRRQTRIKSFINLLFIVCFIYWFFSLLLKYGKQIKKDAIATAPIEELPKINDTEPCENVCGVKWRKCTKSCYNKIFERRDNCDDEDVECEAKYTLLTTLSCSRSCSNSLESCFSKCKSK